jgi:transposase-like protein
MVSYASRKELGADLQAIFSAPAKGQALQIASSVAQKWRKKKANEKSAEHIEEHLEECLCSLAFPESHRRRVRTSEAASNVSERGDEIKMRTRVARIFPNREACLRLVTALAVEQSEEWVTGALPGYARARRAPPERRAGSRGGVHEGLEQRLGFEEITETSGVDLPPPPMV